MAATGTKITALAWETLATESPTVAEYAANWGAMDIHVHDNRGGGGGVRALQTATAPAAAGDVQLTGDTLTWWGVTAGAVKTAVSLDGTQTLTNKTLTSPIIGTISNTGTLTLPTSTDTLVGRATADTLTNKTLSGGTFSGTFSGAHTLSGAVTMRGGKAGNLGVGAAPLDQFGLYLAQNVAPAAAVSVRGVYVNQTLTPNQTGSAFYGVDVNETVATALGAMSSYYAYHAFNPTKTGGGSIPTVVGAYIDSMTAGATNNYGLVIEAPSGATGDNIGLWNKGVTKYGARVQNKQGSSIASANNLALGTDGNYFNISGTTQVNLLDNTGWQGGSQVTIFATSGFTVKHNQATSSTFTKIVLNGGLDFAIPVNGTLTLVYDSLQAFWVEIGRKA